MNTMNNLPDKKIKITLMISIMLFAGICYSCSLHKADNSWNSQEESVFFLSEEKTQASVLEAASKEEKEENLETASMEDDSEDESDADGCFVHICGAINHPGVYFMPKGSRIYQLVEEAGGFLPEADQAYLNLASPVSDGMKVTVWTKEEAQTAEDNTGIVLPSDQGQSLQTGKVNINTAGKEELMSLRGIGESRAEDIIAYREKHGFFQKIEDIMKVSGIKDAAFEKIKEKITV